jgi:hypothetical protein
MNTKPLIERFADTLFELAQPILNAEEVVANKKWNKKNKEIREALIDAGWEDGQPYCMYSCKAAWLATYRKLNAPQSIIDLVKSTLNGSVVASWSNCGEMRILTRYVKELKLVQRGAIFFLRKGQTSSGHAGIVSEMIPSTMRWSYRTIEGNTSPQAKTASKDREGDGFYSKVRPVDGAHTNGLWLMGFVNPPMWAEK